MVSSLFPSANQIADIFFMVAINDNTQSREHSDIYHYSFSSQYINQYVMDTILDMFALELPVCETWHQRLY